MCRVREKKWLGQKEVSSLGNWLVFENENAIQEYSRLDWGSKEDSLILDQWSLRYTCSSQVEMLKCNLEIEVSSLSRSLGLVLKFWGSITV